jgi:hypothetical protein
MLVFAPGAAAAIPAPPSQWYSLPGLNAASGASFIRALAHATPPNTIYAGVEGGGVFKSSNGGATWSAFSAGLPAAANVRALLTDTAGTTAYAGTDSGVWKSTGGGGWEPLGQATLSASVVSLIELPGNTVLAGVASGGVWRSTDGGATWTAPAAGNGMPSGESPNGFVAQPTFVLAATTSGVFRSSDSGATWTLVSDGVPSTVSSLQPWVDPDQPSLLYLSTNSNGVYRSVNGGATWSAVNDGFGAVRARGFQIFADVPGAHLYAATENGLWEALNLHTTPSPAPRWNQVTQQGLGGNVSMWALTAPVIPGSGAPGLIAGTQTDGGYFLSFEPPDSACPTSHTTNTTASCPRLVDTSPQVGDTLTALNGAWTGTPAIDYAYQWQQCTSTSASSCTDIADAEETSYLVPPAGQGTYYRVKVTARNAAPSFGGVFRTSAISSVTAAGVATMPGYNQAQNPSITVTPPDHQSAPAVGDSLFAAKGSLTAADPTYGWFNPSAIGVSFQWLRCESADADCNEIPGATARSYTLTRVDGARQLRVRVTGSNGSGARALTSAATAAVISAPAAVGDPISDPDGGPAKPQDPAIVGAPFIGETLAGTAGGWKDPTTEFSRTWLRCDAGGGACTPIAGETGSIYLIRADDAGSTLRMRVRADVNGDLGNGGADDPPYAIEVDTAPTAVIAARPVPPVLQPPNPVPPGGGAAADTLAPVVSALKVTNKKFAVAAPPTALVARRAPKGTRFTFRLSEAATATLRIDRLLPGRKVGRACRKPTRTNRKAKRCLRPVKAGTLTRRNLKAGRVSIAFSGRIGKKKLRPGSYQVTVVAKDAAGNRSKPARATFRIVRR